ncbi:MAG: dTDP-4-dehydrorhamnose 3,5-epimerase [Cyanobacteria bacterium K_Offshore_0m_m2_072]|nr:dTDP-4-dehydrorhamnose 3,5-epimerase [Cyanobacteria bacterium K_Offshore_0m_m2_072]
MQVETLTTSAGVPLHGPLLLTPRVFGDSRGFFFESWNQNAFAAALEAHGQSVPGFVQDNHSRSSSGVLRGLHFQLPPHPQGKLVRCVVGEIFDVAVDLRGGSASFGHWVGALLGADNHQQLWVPSGFAHGFLILSKHAEVLYKTTDFWRPECERALRWNDPALGIAWPLARLGKGGLESESPQLSEKDALAPLLESCGADLRGVVWGSEADARDLDPVSAAETP